MSVVVSSSLVLSDEISGGDTVTLNNPLIGYQNLVTTGNVSSTTAATDFPVTNLANVSTNLKWTGVVGSPEADQYITFDLNTNEDVDYIAIARHNLYTQQIPVSIEILNEETSPDSWDELTSPVLLPNDGPALFRFTPQGVASIRIRLQPGDGAPSIAVVYAGKLLVLQRRIYVGHTPINMGVTTNVANSRSESGDFLGRIILSETTKTSFSLQDLTPNWYRTYLNPFVVDSRENPFFFAWRPSDYPYEIGYAWMTNDPQPVNQRPNGMMQISFEMSGVS